MRTLSVKADAPTADGVVMVVVNQADMTKSLIIEGEIRGETSRFPRHFTVALPAGQYTVSFMRNGQLMWPRFVKPIFEVPPACGNYVGVNDVSFNKPSPARGECAVGSNLIYNSIFAGSIVGYGHLNAGIEYSPTAGVGSSGALVTNGRTNFHGNQVSQHLDASCIQPGNVYAINVSIRVVGANGIPVPVCVGLPFDCPDILITSERFDPYTRTTATRHNIVAATDVSSLAAGFYQITGTWTVPPEDANTDLFNMRISNGRGELIIDNVFFIRIA